MGYLLKDTCFVNSVDASNSFFSSAPIYVSTLGATTPSTYTTYYTFVASVWRQKTEKLTSGVTTVFSDVVATPPTFATCDPYQPMNDGITLAWLVVLVWTTAWGISVIRKAL